jgi:hypothetical protein
VIKQFLRPEECEDLITLTRVFPEDRTMRVHLNTPKFNLNERVDRKYYSISSRIPLVRKVREFAEKKWGISLFPHEHFHLMHYLEKGNGLKIHAEPNIATVSASINLSSPTYKGGEFYIKNAPVNLGQGDLILYDSNIMHGVTPLEEGQRYSFVLWMRNRKQYESDRNKQLRQSTENISQESGKEWCFERSES